MTEILAACATLPEADFAAEDWLMREGEPGGRLYLLVSGEVVVLKNDTEITRIAEPGAVFGEMSALLGLPFTASVRALVPVRALVSENGAEFLAANPALTLHAARVLAQRLQAATAYLADVKAQFADQANHFAMMDRILDQLMQRQAPRTRPPETRPDPRL